jgi:hypothetical protein
MNSFFGISIYRLVLKALKSRIALAQKQYDTGSKDLDAKCEEQQKAAERERDTGNIALADKLVASIIGK